MTTAPRPTPLHEHGRTAPRYDPKGARFRVRPERLTPDARNCIATALGLNEVPDRWDQPMMHHIAHIPNRDWENEGLHPYDVHAWVAEHGFAHMLDAEEHRAAIFDYLRRGGSFDDAPPVKNHGSEASEPPA